MKRTTTISRSALARTVVVARLCELAYKGAGALALLLAMPANAQQAQPTNLPVVVADFNHDGIPDVLVQSTGRTPATATISFGASPYGTFASTAKTVAFPVCTNGFFYGGFQSGDLLTGDFNGDGIPDILFSCRTANAYAAGVMLGFGDGTFAPAQLLTGTLFTGVLVGDFNRDGKLDIVGIGALSGSQPYGILFYAGNGDGTFASPVSSPFGTTTSFSPINAIQTAVAVDVDGDGYPDIAGAAVFDPTGGSAGGSESGPMNLYVFANNRDGTFGTQSQAARVPTTTITLGTYPATISLNYLFSANIYGSGKLDLAITDSGTTRGIFLLQNTSSIGSFSFATPVKTAYAGLLSASAGSVTSNGFSDLVVTNGTSLSVLSNDGTGNFNASYNSLTIPSTASLFAVADANGDGHADIYTATMPTTINAPAITVNLVSGTASATTAPLLLSAGTVPVSATWPGNINFAGSTANGSQTVNAISTAVALASSKSPSFLGDAVTFTAAVSPSNFGNYIPSGTVTFMDGTTTLSSVPLASGAAMLTVTTFSAGSHSISAVYSGDSIFGASSQNLTQQVNALTLTSISPNTGQLGDAAKTITITGSGFVTSTVAQVNGTSIATTFVNPTTLMAIVPASYFNVNGTLQITLSNPTTGAVTTAQPLTVTAPTPAATITAPSTSGPGTQPPVTFSLGAPYPLPLVATFTLNDKSGIASGAVDPAVQFATGGTTFTVNIPAGTTTIPAIQVQAGTIAATITVPVTLTANGVNVTPGALAATIVVPAAVPDVTATTLARSGNTLTIMETGFSNTREIVSATFHFTPVAGATLTTADFTAPVGPAFSTWFADPASLTYGSAFSYSQVFNVSDDASKIASVQVTLTNSIGVSTTQTAQ